MNHAQKPNVQSFHIDFKGFLLPVEPTHKGDEWCYSITFPDTSVMQIGKKESRFRMIHSTPSPYLTNLCTGESRIQEFGSLIEQYYHTIGGNN